MALLLAIFTLAVLITLSLFIGKNNFEKYKKKIFIMLCSYFLVAIPILVFNPVLLEMSFVFGLIVALISILYYIFKFFLVLIINKKKIKLRYNLIFLVIVFFFNLCCFIMVTPPLTSEQIAARELETSKKNKEKEMQEKLELEKNKSKLLEKEKEELEKELNDLKSELEDLKLNNNKVENSKKTKPSKPTTPKPINPKYDLICSKCSLGFNFGSSNYGHDADGIAMCKKCFTAYQKESENIDLEKRPDYSADIYGVKCYAENLGNIKYSDGSTAAVVGLKSANSNYSNLKAIIIMKGKEKIYQNHYYFNSQTKDLYLDGRLFEATESYVGLDSLSGIANSDYEIFKIKLKYGLTPYVCYYKYYL